MGPDPSTTLPAYFLRVRGTAAQPTWKVSWRHALPDGGRRLVKRKVGPAWVELDRFGHRHPRRGRPPAGQLDERAAFVAAAACVEAGEDELRGAEEALNAPPTFREVAHAWMEWLEHVRGAKPSTLREHWYQLAEPGSPHARGSRVHEGLIMRTFGNRPAADITTRDVDALLRVVAARGVSARTVNKVHNLLGAVYNWGCRLSTYDLPTNPVRYADKRREAPPGTLDYYSVEQVELVARTIASGHWRIPAIGLGDEEVAARAAEDRRDAEAVRISAYTGLRKGELRALRWRDIDFAGSKLTIRRTISAGQLVDSTKSGRIREVPLADVAMAALDRLSRSEDFTGPDDYVLCSRVGGILDESALRRRFAGAQAAASLPKLTWHGLRHTFGSLCAADPTMDFVTLKAAMGHARLTTTERYLHARPASESAARFSAVFARGPLGPADRLTLPET